MAADIFADAGFMRRALDLMPSIIVVTDEDVRILFRNAAARELLKGPKLYGNRIGHVMHCLYSDNDAGGCGRGAHCTDCVLRNSVNDAFSGRTVRRRRADLTIRAGDRTLQVPALVSVSVLDLAGARRAMVVIEDISELVELRSLLPICSSCKKVRSEAGRWEDVELYLRHRLPDSRLSHGLCPDCARKLYPKHSD